MYFKSAVILYALYFVPVTQSVGLNMNDVQRIVDLFKGDRKPINKFSMMGIKKLGNNVGKKIVTSFEEVGNPINKVTLESIKKSGENFGNNIVNLIEKDKTLINNVVIKTMKNLENNYDKEIVNLIGEDGHPISNVTMEGIKNSAEFFGNNIVNLFEKDKNLINKVTIKSMKSLADNCGKKIDNLFDEDEKPIQKVTMEDIEKLANNFGIENFSDFKYNQDLSNDELVQDLLVFLANYDKRTDYWMLTPSLTSYEVRIYVGLFKQFENVKPLDDRLRLIISSLNLNIVAKNRLLNNVLILVGEVGGVINASVFLEAFLSIKSQGRVLDLNQVQNLMDLYKDHKTDDNHIEPDEITKWFTKFSIVAEDQEKLLVFPSIRSAALELQELLIVTAECKKGVDVNAVKWTSERVRYLIREFFKRDYDKNGLLEEDEFTGCIENHNIVLAEFDYDGDQLINIAEYFMVYFRIFINSKKDETY